MKKINDGLTKEQRFALRHPEAAKEKSRKHYANNAEKRRQQRREYYARDPERARFANLKRWYGVSEEQYRDMLASQNAKCAICGTDFAEFSKRPCVDHDHSTGKVRDLLCGPCNVKVGVVETEGPWRESVLAYIAKHKNES